MFLSYQEMYLNAKSMEFIVELRLQMVRYAHEHGYKPASRMYNCSKNVIKKWCRRYALKGKQGLVDISRKPHTSPNKLDENSINKITTVAIEAKNKNKYITTVNVIKKAKVNNCSYETANRYVNAALGKKRNKVRAKTNGGSTKFKQNLKPFELIQVDIKYLTDIPSLKPYFKNENLMKYQITARDVCSGYPIVAYCDEKALTYTKIFLENILHPFLKQIPYLDLKTITIQTDNGTEFTNKDRKTTKKDKPVESKFTLFIQQKYKRHKTIIPGHCTAQSEVESFHWSIERDCLAWEDIVDNKTLIDYTTSYIEEYVNSKIKTRGYSPMDKIKEVCDITKVTFPKPQILSVKSPQIYR